jgi:hypothetical protein
MHTLTLAFVGGPALAASAVALALKPAANKLDTAPPIELVDHDCGWGWHHVHWQCHWGYWHWHCDRNDTLTMVARGSNIHTPIGGVQPRAGVIHNASVVVLPSRCIQQTMWFRGEARRKAGRIQLDGLCKVRKCTEDPSIFKSMRIGWSSKLAKCPFMPVDVDKH